MKILKIELRNIASLKGDHTVDFTQNPLNHAGLFLISGPTGSGKSTLLDAICLAIYNRMPRLGKVSKNELLSSGSVITRHTSDALARVTYSCTAGVFSSQWQISTNSRGNLNDYQLELFNAMGQSMGLKKSEVPLENERLIGLDYEQFTRAVVLAQGEFAQFLKSDEKTRAALLEKITGERIYRELGKAAYERAKNLRVLSTQLLDQQEGLRQQLLDQEVFELKTNEKTKLEEALARALEVQKQKELAVTHRKSLLQAKSQLAALFEKEQQSKASWSAWEEVNGSKLKRHDSLQPIRTELNTWHASQTELKALSATLAQSQSNLLGAESTALQLRNRAAEVLGAFEEGDDLMETLDLFSRKVRKLHQAEIEAREKAKVSADLLNTFITQQPEWSGSSLDGFDALIQTWENAKAKNAERLVFLTTQDAELGASGLDDDSLDEWDQRCHQWVHLENSWNERQAQAQQLQQSIDSIHEKVRDLPEAIALAGSTLKLATAEEDAAEARWSLHRIQSSLSEHRSQLQPGEACPLCGALEHPSADGFDEAAGVSLKDVAQAAKERVVKLQSEHQRLVSQLEVSQANLEQEKAHLEGLRLSEVQRRLQLVIAEFPEDWRNLSGSSCLTRLRDWKTNRIGLRLEEERLNQLKAGFEQLQTWHSKFELHLQCEAEFKQIWSSTESIDDFMSQWNGEWAKASADINQFQAQLKTTQSSLLGLQARFEKAIEQIETSIQEIGIPTIDLAWSQLLNPMEEEQLRKDEKQLLLHHNQLKTEHESQFKAVQILQEKDAKGTEEELLAALESAKNLALQLSHSRDELISSLNQHVNAKTRMLELEAERLRILGDGKKWVQLDELMGDSGGHAFNKFAQQLTTNQLIAMANRRLEGLTDRYRFAFPESDGPLAVLDEHMANERRSVQTLSGGETFLMSLGLALALSDLAARNADVGDLFIDEGFGTLDPATLDGVLDVLERLQATAGRNVGIISHVEGLKERIATQVRLEPTGHGHSKIRIVQGV